MKLYVDDTREAPDETWIVARSVSEAIRVLNAFHFDHVSLDHDISHQVKFGVGQYPMTCPEDFATVALFLALKYKGVEKKPIVTIHTGNPVGAHLMGNILGGFKIIDSPPNK